MQLDSSDTLQHQDMQHLAHPLMHPLTKQHMEQVTKQDKDTEIPWQKTETDILKIRYPR